MRPDQQLAAMVRETVEDVFRPNLDMVTAVMDACDEHEDDATLGRHVREIVSTFAAARIDRSIARRSGD